MAELEREKDPAMVKKLLRCKAGRPLKLGKYDDVKKYATSLRLAGGIVNRSVKKIQTGFEKAGITSCFNY